jgi:dihydrofolate reductase
MVAFLFCIIIKTMSMENFILSAVVAVAENNVIGVGNNLPWKKQKSDMKRFVSLTKHNTIIVGRKTFESFGGKPLKDRFHMILTKDPNFAVAKEYEYCCRVYRSIEEILKHLKEVADAMNGLPNLHENRMSAVVIGGGEIYKQFMPHLDGIFLTKINVCNDGGDVFFPNISEKEFKLMNSEFFKADEENDNDYEFHFYERLE